MGLTDTEPPSP